jgi:hypothetical protein
MWPEIQKVYCLLGSNRSDQDEGGRTSTRREPGKSKAQLLLVWEVESEQISPMPESTEVEWAICVATLEL